MSDIDEERWVVHLRNGHFYIWDRIDNKDPDLSEAVRRAIVLHFFPTATDVPDGGPWQSQFPA